MTKPPDPIGHKSLAQHERESREAPVDNLRERVGDLERRVKALESSTEPVKAGNGEPA